MKTDFDALQKYIDLLNAVQKKMDPTIEKEFAQLVLYADGSGHVEFERTYIDAKAVLDWSKFAEDNKAKFHFTNRLTATYHTMFTYHFELVDSVERDGAVKP